MGRFVRRGRVEGRHFEKGLLLCRLDIIEIKMKALLAVLFLLGSIFLAYGQESINVHKGINVGMHAGVALLMSFGILGTCILTVNLIHRNCKCARHMD